MFGSCAWYFSKLRIHFVRLIVSAPGWICANVFNRFLMKRWWMPAYIISNQKSIGICLQNLISVKPCMWTWAACSLIWQLIIPSIQSIHQLMYCLSILSSIYQSSHQSIHLPLHPSINPSVCPDISLLPQPLFRGINPTPAPLSGPIQELMHVTNER